MCAVFSTHMSVRRWTVYLLHIHTPHLETLHLFLFLYMVYSLFCTYICLFNCPVVIHSWERHVCSENNSAAESVILPNPWHSIHKDNTQHNKVKIPHWFFHTTSLPIVLGHTNKARKVAVDRDNCAYSCIVGVAADYSLIVASDAKSKGQSMGGRKRKKCARIAENKRKT